MNSAVPIAELNRIDAGPLRRVSLQVRAGEVVAVMGPVGAGRTTLAAVLTGEVTPDAGRVVLDGVDVTALDAASRARFGLGWVRGTPRPFPTLTVAENVLVAASATRRRGGREALVRTRWLLERSGLAAVADTPAWQLSPEQLVVLEVLRVLAAPRRLIVVDELSTRLDPLTRQELASALLATAKQGGAVLWLGAPDDEDLDADRAVLLVGGRVVADGPWREVSASPEYRLVRQRERLTPDGVGPAADRSGAEAMIP
ncbi:MAG: ATP-binding cassette domain-containing protein [Acidimicrobiales bacterium]